MTTSQISGYLGRILRVDLTRQKVVSESLDETTLRKYVGGASLGIKFLYDEVPPGVSGGFHDVSSRQRGKGRTDGEGRENMEEIGKKIRNERKSRGWSLGEMAEKIGISPMTLQRIETGKRSPSVIMLAEIAHLLLKPIDYFIKERNPKLILVKKEQQTIIESPKLKLTVIAPRG